MTDIDRGRVAELTERERARVADRLPRSIAVAKRASLAGDVACSGRALDPFTIYGDRAEGSWLSDLDGNGYVAFDPFATFITA